MLVGSLQGWQFFSESISGTSSVQTLNLHQPSPTRFGQTSVQAASFLTRTSVFSLQL